MDKWAISFFSLFGVVLGAVLQFWLSRTTQREKHAANLQSQAYADYLRAVAAAAHLRSDEDLRDAHREAADAKARIAVYGSASVIRALSQFEKAGAVLNNARSGRTFISLVSSMRSGKEIVSDRDLELVLLGTIQHDDVSKDSAKPRADANAGCNKQ